MADQELILLWKKIEELLNRAILHVPDNIFSLTVNGQTTVEEMVNQAKDFLSHNELGLAFDSLEEISAEYSQDDVFDESMIQASILMGISFKGKSHASN